MDAVDSFKEWLEQPQYKSVRTNDIRPNWALRQGDAFDPRDLADIPGDGGERVYVQEFRTYHRGVAFRVEFKVSDVKVVQVCQDGHDWDDWHYDFMGGDIRTCKRCGEVEMC